MCRQSDFPGSKWPTLCKEYWDESKTFIYACKTLCEVSILWFFIIIRPLASQLSCYKSWQHLLHVLRSAFLIWAVFTVSSTRFIKRYSMDTLPSVFISTGLCRITKLSFDLGHYSSLFRLTGCHTSTFKRSPKWAGRDDSEWSGTLKVHFDWGRDGLVPAQLGHDLCLLLYSV